jgi:Domain of unknown function (DUF4352)
MSNLIECKACGKEIAKGVKKCPHCGKDQRNWFMRHKIMTFILVIIVIGIISSLAGGGEETATDSTTQKSGETTEQAEKIYKVNEPITVDDKAEVVVTKVEEMSTIGDPEFLGKQASEGGTLVAVQLTVKNISNEPIGAFSTPTFNLVDEKGTKYESDIDASGAYAIETNIDNSKLMSDLNPGIKVTDVQVYEISKDAYAAGKWYVQISGGEKVQIK